MQYCSKECQAKDWISHKPMCLQIRANNITKQEKHTINNLLSLLWRTGITKKLSCLKQYSIQHKLDIGKNCFHLAETSIAHKYLHTELLEVFKLPNTAKMYVVVTELITTISPNQFTVDRLNIGIAIPDEARMSVTCMQDTTLPTDVVKRVTLEIFTQHVTVKHFFSATADNIHENMLLVVPDKNEIYLLHASKKGFKLDM